MSRPSVRIAFVHYDLTPHKSGLFEELARDVDLHVIAGDRPTRLHERQVAAARGFQYHRLRQLPLSPGKQRKRGVSPATFPLNLLAQLRKINPDVVISQEMGLRSLFALLYAAIARKRFVLWWEGTEWTQRNRGFARRVAAGFFARTVQAWITHGGSSDRRFLLSVGVPDARIFETRYCGATAALERMAQEDAPKRGSHGICVAGLFRRKGLDRLIRALKHTRGEVAIEVIGDGPELEALRKLAADLDVSRKIAFLGAMPHSEALEKIRRAAFFVFPTLEDQWGAVVSEAVWLGTPVLCSARAGAAELVPGDQVFDPDDIAALARLLDRASTGSIAASPRREARSERDLAATLATHLRELAQSTI